MITPDANVLSVRPRSAAESPYSRAVYLGDERLGATLDSAERVVILVHGFNTPSDSAERAFAGFTSRLSARIRADEIWAFHWPGDHPDAWRSKATYSARVGLTPGIGERLGDFIVSRLKNKQVVLIGHSLGCRIVLEAILKIAAEIPLDSQAPVLHAFLLAAAVPHSLCEPLGGRFPAPLSGSREHAFFSPDDTVLSLWFEPGQRLFSPLEVSEAVGLRGRPGPARWQEPWNTWLRHNEYWTDRVVSDEVLRRLSHPVPRPVARRRMNPARLASRGTVRAVLTVRRLRTRRI